MNIQKTDESCYLIELSKEDMKNYRITYNFSGHCCEKEEAAFMHILKEHTGKPLSGKVTVDILPGISGGCLAVIKEQKTDSTTEIFESTDIDNFIDCAKILKEKGIIAPASLYKDESTYRLIVTKSFSEVSLLLCEFSKILPSGKAVESYTERYMKCLIRDKALEILSGK